MALYAQVIIDIAHTNVDRVFAYSIPAEEAIEVGQRVLVPFGRGNTAKEGYVIALCEQVDVPKERIKPILRKAEGFAALLPEQVRLASWMAQRYHCLMVDALRLMIPAQIRGDRVHEKTLGVAVLTEQAATLQTVKAALYTKGGACKAPVQKQVLELLEQMPEGMAVTDLYAFLPGCNSAVAALKKKGALIIKDVPVRRTPYKQMAPGTETRPVLTDEQAEAFHAIEQAMDEPRPGQTSFLLHGATGSGKTEVYLCAIEHALQKGQGAIALVPEISLTPQMVQCFRSRLGEPVAVLHSRLSAGERYDEWRRIRNGQARVVIGPRSALFAPVQNVGLIVIDEEHEQSYRNEQRPQFESAEVARKRLDEQNGVLVLGSATPSVTTYYQCVQGKLRLLEMPTRVGKMGLPKVVVTDMREELKRGNRTVFSGVLYEAMRHTLERGEQMMLFINRRGYSTFVQCRGCGYVMQCEHCDVSMTLHKSSRGDFLRCHYCGQQKAIPPLCPVCGKPYLKQFGMGTQLVEEQVRQHFPQARILRMDYDTTQGKDAHLNILQSFGRREADVLIGTQMIAKGLDFGGVTLVGVVAADASLYLPDPRSAERTFQLIMQVAGRAGRDQLPGQVVVQTYHPDHFAIDTAARQDYKAFYRQEIQNRQIAQFPPFANFVRLLFRGQAEQAVRAAKECHGLLLQCLKEHNIVPLQLEMGYAPIARIKDETRTQILLKLPSGPQADAALDALYTLFYRRTWPHCTLTMETNPSNMV